MFKKLTFLLLTIFAVSYAAAPSTTLPTVFWVYEADTAIDTNGAFDTLLNATDSSTLLSGFSVKPGYTYQLSRDAITGTGSDSVTVIVNIDAIDENDNLIHRFPADSFTASAGEAIELPFYKTVFGENGKWRIMLKSYAGHGSQVILNRFYMWRMYPTQIARERKQRK